MLLTVLLYAIIFAAVGVMRRQVPSASGRRESVAFFLFLLLIFPRPKEPLVQFGSPDWSLDTGCG